ncbi:hypothetical protein KUCAC02_005560, partial [Chaenocephalus aceratus]
LFGGGHGRGRVREECRVGPGGWGQEGNGEGRARAGTKGTAAADEGPRRTEGASAGQDGEQKQDSLEACGKALDTKSNVLQRELRVVLTRSMLFHSAPLHPVCLH